MDKESSLLATIDKDLFDKIRYKKETERRKEHKKAPCLFCGWYLNIYATLTFRFLVSVFNATVSDTYSYQTLTFELE